VAEDCDASWDVVAEDWYVSFSDLASEYFDLGCFFEWGLYVAASGEYCDLWVLFVI